MRRYRVGHAEASTALLLEQALAGSTSMQSKLSQFTRTLKQAHLLLQHSDEEPQLPVQSEEEPLRLSPIPSRSRRARAESVVDDDVWEESRKRTREPSVSPCQKETAVTAAPKDAAKAPPTESLKSVPSEGPNKRPRKAS